jgi:hypothetical protein
MCQNEENNTQKLERCKAREGSRLNNGDSVRIQQPAKGDDRGPDKGLINKNTALLNRKKSWEAIFARKLPDSVLMVGEQGREDKEIIQSDH